MTKTISFVFATFFLLLASCSQPKSDNKVSKGDEEVIKKDIVQFMETYMNKGEWEGVINMMYPKLFTIAPKEQIIAQMEQMELSGVSITAKNTKVVKISDVVVYEDEQFCLIDYKSDIKITIAEQATNNIPMFKAQFEQAYGRSNVTFDEKNNVFNIKGNKTMVGVAPINTNDWGYFEFNKNQPQILDALLPKEVLNGFL